jgi:hypothetical protein
MSFYEDDTPHVTPDNLEKMTSEQLKAHLESLLEKYHIPQRDSHLKTASA